MAEFVYYENKKSKWLVTFFTFIITIILSPLIFQSPIAFFCWFIISGTFTVLVWLRKQSNKPKLIFDNTTIRTERGDVFNINAIGKIELEKKPAWKKHASIYLILYFKDSNGIAEIEASGLDKSPNEILSKLNSLIS